MRIALDSNILIYSAGITRSESDTRKTEQVRAVLGLLYRQVEIVCPWQTFGEAFNVMHKSGRTREECRHVLLQWRSRFGTCASSESAFLSALDLATDKRLRFWDALIIDVAAEAACELLLSEDLQNGYVWRGVTIVNPLATPPHPRLAAVLGTIQ